MAEFHVARPKRIVVKVDMPDGTTKEFSCERVTREIMSSVATALKKYEERKFSDKTGDLLYEQMAIIFGGKKEDYFDIDDIRTVKQIMDFVTDQVKNPE